MKKRASLLMTLLLLIGAHHTQCAEEVCDINLRTKIGAGQVLENGSFVSTKDGALYPFFSFWKDGETTWACPCLLGNCIRICSEGKISQSHNIICDMLDFVVKFCKISRSIGYYFSSHQALIKLIN